MTQGQTRYDDELQKAVKRAELLAEQIALLQRVRQIELELGGAPGAVEIAVRAAVQAQVTKTPKKVLAEGEQPKRRGRPPKAEGDKVVRNGEKRIELPALLEAIAQESNKPLVLTDFVAKAREAGYTTNAKDFTNMVYQALLKLVNKGKFRKNNETREYEYVGKAA